MSVTQWLLIIFVCLEIMNVLTLYFFPGSKKGNGLGVFNAWHSKDENSDTAELITYLVNWVAGVKLIFIGLILLIVFMGDEKLHQAAAVVMLITTLSFFWRLFPQIRKLDLVGKITPKGYSTTLAIMISGFCFIFFVAIVTG